MRKIVFVIGADHRSSDSKTMLWSFCALSDGGSRKMTRCEKMGGEGLSITNSEICTIL